MATRAENVEFIEKDGYVWNRRKREWLQQPQGEAWVKFPPGNAIFTRLVGKLAPEKIAVYTHRNYGWQLTYHYAPESAVEKAKEALTNLARYDGKINSRLKLRLAYRLEITSERCPWCKRKIYALNKRSLDAMTLAEYNRLSLRKAGRLALIEHSEHCQTRHQLEADKASKASFREMLRLDLEAGSKLEDAIRFAQKQQEIYDIPDKEYDDDDL